MFLTSFEAQEGQVVGLSGATQDGGTVQFKLIDQTCGVGVGPNLGQGSLHIGLCRISATIQRFETVGMQDEFAAFGKLIRAALIFRGVVDTKQCSRSGDG